MIIIIIIVLLFYAIEHYFTKIFFPLNFNNRTKTFAFSLEFSEFLLNKHNLTLNKNF